MGANVTSGVHSFIKILQPPQTCVHLGHFVNCDFYKIVLYILVNFIWIKRLKNTLHDSGDLALIEQSSLKQQRDKFQWFYRYFAVYIISL